MHPDILCVVMEFVADDEDGGIPTISAITRTCKQMRFEGIKYLLSGTVELLFLDRVCSFCHFMLADKPARLPLLRSLVLKLYSIKEEEHVALVCEMLRGLSKLYDLDITLDASSSPIALKAISAAVASLTSLRELRLAERLRLTSVPVDRDPVFETALRNTQAPIISLCIALGGYIEDAQTARVRYNRKRDPIFLSSLLRNTLERLEVSGGITLIVRPGRKYEFPHLKQLILPLYHVCAPYLKPFIVSAPHLRDLQQLGGRFNTPIRHRHDEDILRGRIINKTRTPQEWRTTNQGDQEAMGKGWPMLDSFKGAIIGAYATGLSCPVTRVHLLSTGGQRTMELAMLSIVLSDWRPLFLRLATKVYRARGYIPLLPSTSSGWAEALETLEIRLNMVGGRFNYAECFDHIGRMLSTLSVTSLRLEFCCVNTRMQTRISPDPLEGEECEIPGSRYSDAFCYMQDGLSQEDLPQRVRDCMRSAPALRRMTLVWGRCRALVPNRVICVDLDDALHVCDRPGDKSDEWCRLNRDW